MAKKTLTHTQRMATQRELRRRHSAEYIRSWSREEYLNELDAIALHAYGLPFRLMSKVPTCTSRGCPNTSERDGKCGPCWNDLYAPHPHS